MCHQVIIDKNSGEFNSSSPDELALVDGAKQLGYEFVGKQYGNLVVKTPDGYTKKFELLNTLEFNSTRKRMSVIVKDLQTYEIVVLSKGADSIMEKLLVQNSDTKDYMTQLQGYIDSYANEGLRTLLLARRVVSQSEYANW